MPKINFTIPEMYPLLKSGAKDITIRPFTTRFNAGDTLHVWLGNRFKGQEKLGTAKILRVVNIMFNNSQINWYNEEPIDNVIARDGFNSMQELFDYHCRNDKFTLINTLVLFGAQSWL